MPTIELRTIAAVIEDVRREMHPGLDRRFLEMVIDAEEQNPDDDAQAMRAIDIALRTLIEDPR